MDVRRMLREGRTILPTAGVVRENPDGLLPFVVVYEVGRPLVPFAEFLRELMLGDASQLTCRSYRYDLLRWWRLLRSDETRGQS